MKLDIELIKKILEYAINDESWPMPIEKFSIEGYDQKIIQYHLYQMEEANLIVSYSHPYECLEDQVPILLIHRLTMEGHSFYANALSENAWNSTLAIFKSLGGFSLGIFSQVLAGAVLAYAKNHLGLP